MINDDLYSSEIEPEMDDISETEQDDTTMDDEPEIEPEETEMEDGVISVNVNFERQGKFIVCTDRNFHPAIYRSKGRTPITFDRDRVIKVWGSDELRNAELMVNGHLVRLGQRFGNEWFYAQLSQDVIDAIIE